MKPHEDAAVDSPPHGDIWAAGNVDFAFDEALQAARDLYELSGVVDAKQDARATAAVSGVEGWEGDHRTAFDTRLTTEGTDAGTIRGALISLADLFASEWAAARGEQDRINHARYVKHEKDNDSWAEDGVEWVAGEDDYGAPPGDPPVPESPDYAPTRDPVHPEFENA
jgi:hypothetical protein